MQGFFPTLSGQELRQMNMLALAHVGDAVYELLFRSKLCCEGPNSVEKLHRQTVENVRAESQSAAAEKLLPILSEEELSVYRRGRNTKVNSVPHHANIGQYHAATGLEALFGWLYLQGRVERINELFACISEG